MKYTYTFDQLRDDPELAERLFEDYKSTIRRFGSVDTDLYCTADFGVVEADSEIEACERLFRAYNSDVRPEGYAGRSMSVSDIVTLWNNDREPPVKSEWFCDSISFVFLGRTIGAARKCPMCGREYADRPALSRKDNESAICPDCGTREALEARSMDELQEAIDKLKKALAEMGEPILKALEETCRHIQKMFPSIIDKYATPKERYYMHHARRYRVRKKYRDRVCRRISEEK